jgi:hypothetical protein
MMDTITVYMVSLSVITVVVIGAFVYIINIFKKMVLTRMSILEKLIDHPEVLNNKTLRKKYDKVLNIRLNKKR